MGVGGQVGLVLDVRPVDVAANREEAEASHQLHVVFRLDLSVLPLLSARALVRVPNRGKALANWARPSIDEMCVPTKPWAQEHAKIQSKYNMQLVAGLGLLSVCSYIYWSNIKYKTNLTPHHLLKN